MRDLNLLLLTSREKLVDLKSPSIFEMGQFMFSLNCSEPDWFHLSLGFEANSFSDSAGEVSAFSDGDFRNQELRSD